MIAHILFKKKKKEEEEEEKKRERKKRKKNKSQWDFEMQCLVIVCVFNPAI